MSAWNGVSDDPNSDACCACHDAADPGRYVAGLGLLCQECYAAEFEPDDDEWSMVQRSGGLLP